VAVSNSYKATLMLGLVSIGFFVSYPFSHSFWGGLAASGSSAAMVGGLADWFAVSALFHRPLGIPFRTEIIPKNRRRLEQAIVEMVEEELLTYDNIREFLERYDVVEMLSRYLDDYGGRSELKELGQRLSNEMLEKVDTDRLANFFAFVVRGNAEQIKLAGLLSEMLIWSINQGYFDKLVDFIIDELIRLSNEPQLKTLLGTLFDEAKKIYERGLQRRQFAGKVLEGLGLTADTVGALIVEKASIVLSQMKSEQHSTRIFLRQNATVLAERLANDEYLAQRVEAWKNRVIAQVPDLSLKISAFFKTLMAGLMSESGRGFINKRIDSEVDKILADLNQQDGRWQHIGGLLKQAFLVLVETKHNHIGVIVRARLQQFSTEELVMFIEERVRKDLDIIRINGSIVGGVAGMVIYLAGYWW